MHLNRRTVIIVLAAAVTLVAGLPPRNVHGAPSHDPAVVFARLQGAQGHEDYELWTMGRNGKDQTRLTNNAVADHDPVWSPDGSQIAWVRYETQFNGGPGDIWLMNADGSGRRRLTNHHAFIERPTWSPDGGRIAFMMEYGIHVIDVDGTGERRISPADAFDFGPAWSPDGGTIAFVSTAGRGFDLFTMRPDGSHRRRLVHTAGIADFRPAWSPDGTRIAFGGSDRRTSWHVYVMNRDGTGVVPLVEPYSLDPAWFPDGSRLAFYACLSDCGLHQVRTTGHALRTLGRVRGFSDIQPDVRPS